MARVRENPLAAWLTGFALVAIVGLGIVLATVSAEDREALWVEVGKGLIQIVTVVVLGGALKLVADRYQQRLERAEATSRALAAKEDKDQTFRQREYDALVDTTNALRKVPIFIAANRSVKTWSEQMSDVIDASLALRAIKHEIYSSRGVAGRPFRDTAALVYLFEVMYHYTDWVADDFAANKSDLAQLQAHAEVKELKPEEQRPRKAAVWTALTALPSVADMLREPSQQDRDRCRDAIEEKVRPLLGQAEVDEPPPFPEPSWLVYTAAEGIALELLTGATLAPERLA